MLGLDPEQENTSFPPAPGSEPVNSLPSAEEVAKDGGQAEPKAAREATASMHWSHVTLWTWKYTVFRTA